MREAHYQFSPLCVASMGPQLVSCGCGFCAVACVLRRRSFNGAAARELRMHVGRGVDEEQHRLQWGRSS